jgi:PleD family two-component response regulator
MQLGTNSMAGEPVRETTGALDVVLVIDDSEIARAQMVDVLTEAGMKVVDLPSPIGATRTILEHEVTVVVLDLFMPTMRGDRLAALFRGNPRLKNLGVVLVSGANEAELRRLSNEVDADAIVSKARLGELADAVTRARAKRAVRG